MDDSPTHQYNDGPATRIVSVSLIDEDGQHTSVAQTQVDVINLAPSISDFMGDSVGAEGDSFSYFVIANDPGSGDLPLLYSWNFGDDSPVQSGIGLSSVNHVFVDNGEFLVEVTVYDGDGGQALRQYSTHVSNVAPTLVITAAANVQEGQTLTLDLSQLIDPGEDTIAEWVVEWGDGGTEVFSVGETISHTYVDELEDIDILVHAVDEDGFHSNIGAHRVSVVNSVPTIVLNEVSFIVTESGSVELTGTIADAGVLDSQFIQIDWGNGAQSEFNLLEAGTFSNVQVFNEAGVFTGSIRVEDNAGSFSIQTFEVDARPTVNLVRISNASETANKPAVFRASIARPVDEDIVLGFLVGGTAVSDIDFATIATNSITIPAGQTSVDWIATPLDDELIEGIESIVVRFDSLISAPAGVTLGSVISATAVLSDNDPDTDRDGISEQVEDGGPNNGDHNLDGIPDSQQNHVASFRNAVDSQYIALVGEAGTQLQKVVSSSTIPSGAPALATFPLGMLEFEIAGLTAGAATTVSLLLPGGSTPTAFYKYGPTADNPTDHWYDFTYDPASQTGAVIDGNQVTLHLIDGARGDADLAVDGRIKDPGTVVWFGAEPAAISAGGPYIVSQGSQLVLRGAAFGTFPSDQVIQVWEWDLSYDGAQFDAQQTGQQVSLISSTAGSTTMALRATTVSGQEFIATTSLDVFNLAPLALPDFATVGENDTLELDVLANDSDPGGDTLQIIPSSVMVAEATFQGNAVTLSDSTVELVDGKVLFNPGSDFDFLSQFDRAIVVISYTIQDDAGIPLLAAAQATVTIQGQNDAPLLIAGNPILVDDLGSFASFRIEDFVGSQAVVGNPAQIVDIDGTEPVGIMLTGTEGLDELAISIDGGVSFDLLDLDSLNPAAAVLLPADTQFVVSRISSGLAKLNYLPWDGAIGAPLQTIDVQLLQQVGQLPDTVGALSLVFANVHLPASVDEGALAIGRIELSSAAELLFASSGIDWTDNATTMEGPNSPMAFIYPDGPVDFLVQPFLIDQTGVKWNLDPSTILVRNVAPEFALLHSDAETLETRSSDERVTLTGSFFEQGWIDTHTAIVNWGDGSAAESIFVDQAADLFAGEHEYAHGGIFTIHVTLEDSNGAVAEATTQAVVEGVGLVGKTLYIIGTDEDDDIELEVDSKRNEIEVEAKFGHGRQSRKIEREFDADQVDRVVAYLFGGDDRYEIKQKSNSHSSPEIVIPQLIFGGEGKDRIEADRDYAGPLEIHGQAGDDRIDGGGADDILHGDEGDDRINGGPGSDIIFGGEGDDRLEGGSEGRWEEGNDIIIGGAGDDRIEGGRGRDLLIGGLGQDELRGNSGGDLLIGGFAAYEQSLDALLSLRAEWTADRDYEERINNLRDGTGPVLTGTGIQLKGSGPDANVFDDNARDRLWGASGSDWFFAQLAAKDDDDKVKKNKYELVDLLDD